MFVLNVFLFFHLKIQKIIMLELSLQDYGNFNVFQKFVCLDFTGSHANFND